MPQSHSCNQCLDQISMENFLVQSQLVCTSVPVKFTGFCAKGGVYVHHQVPNSSTLFHWLLDKSPFVPNCKPSPQQILVSGLELIMKQEIRWRHSIIYLLFFFFMHSDCEVLFWSLKLHEFIWLLCLWYSNLNTCILNWFWDKIDIEVSAGQNNNSWLLVLLLA